ncbi:hypothetical protein G9A89_004384 [Geosiphon pyriformis]|nr:hypothetical protein G9A89_004384 [Geosiphon pyriformis]
MSSGDTTGDETVTVVGSTALFEVVKLETMLEGLAVSVMSLSACLDGLALTDDDIIHWHKDINNLLIDKFNGVRVFTSGLDSGFLGAGVLIVVNSSLAKHVCKVFEVPSRLLSIKLLFKNKLSVSILGLYAGASLVIQFSQASEINSLIAKAINESSFVILGGDFNKNDSYKCVSFKKCFNLGLINSLRGSSFVKSSTWCNSHGIFKTIDYVFVSSNLVGAVVDYGVDGVKEYFDTNHKAVYVSMGLGSLFDVQLNSLRKQANRDCWKYDIKNTSEIKWSEFRNAMAANTVMFLDKFVIAKQFSDLDAMWNIVHKVMVLSAGGMFKKKWFRSFDCVFNKVSFWFHRLELLVLDSVGALPVKSLFLSGASFDVIHSGLAKIKKSYHSFKLLESKCAEESSVRQAIEKRMESFEVNKGHTIRSVLERSFCKVVLDYLVDSRELVLEPELVKSKMDRIMEGWTRKCVVASDISSDWTRQFLPLNHVFDGAFSNIMYSISFDEMFGVILNLPDEKAAGFSGIPNKLWKHCDKLVLDMLLVLLNFCLSCESVPGLWREAWVSMIPKPYKWEGVLTNTCPIALIETARKVLSKILSDWIFLACNTFDVLHEDNFSVLKGMSTQSPIFVIGLVIKDALEKN